MPDRSRLRNSATSASRSEQRLETSELDSEDMPSLDATRSTLRVDTPHTYISCTMAATEVSTRDHRASMPSG